MNARSGVVMVTSIFNEQAEMLLMARNDEIICALAFCRHWLNTDSLSTGGAAAMAPAMEERLFGSFEGRGQF